MPGQYFKRKSNAIRDSVGIEDSYNYCKKCGEYRRGFNFWLDEKQMRHCNVCGNYLQERIR